ncbi:MAG TPA: ABC transporter permease, partial [Phototrophicaceae bacterium]|nr:ABC transporter permease [Phototrophicaceae bacterium]
PSPIQVFDQFIEVLNDGRLWQHTSVTLREVMSGLVVGVSIGMTLGYLIARIPLLDDILSPLIVSLQSTPVVAYAPLLVIWFGSGPTGKTITSALIVFFPMLMNTVVGIRNVPTNLRDLMHISGASKWQTLIKLEIPAALPILMTGLKTGASLAVIGAVVGEFINASAGLGFMITVARSQFDTPLVFVGVITLTFIARLIYGAIAMLEYRLLAWKRY